MPIKILAAFLLLLSYKATVFAQNRTCGTMPHLELLEKKYPGTKAQLQQVNTIIAQWSQTEARSSQAILTIPVVVHVVYNIPAQNISLAQIQSQIDALNEDFNRLNADTINTPAVFKPLAANLQIQFVLAKRDPNGDPTTGVTRTQTARSAFSDDDAIKFTNRGGINGWDRDKYLNIWVGNLGSGLLGYAQFPGAGPINSDGVVIGYRYFGRTGTAQAPFHKGRTATHEVGHWLSLFHIWGDDSGCQQDDLVADTPLQKAENYGCPAFPLTIGPGAACPGANANGAMFMNYMDYVNDACMNLFTVGQSTRVQAAINTFRPTLATSDGAQQVIVLNLDAAIFKIQSPRGSSCNPQFTPKVILKNKGTTTLTSATITYAIGNGSPQVYNWTGSLATFATTEITLPVQNAVPGNHTFTAATSLPNGQTDNDALNDSQTVSFVVTPQVPGLNLPFAESFECSTCLVFPFPGFTLNNPDNDFTWEQASVGIHGNKSAYINNYDYYYIGEFDELVFNPLNLTSAQAPQLTFQVAYTPTSFGGPFGDTLEVLASTDCGLTFTSIYKKTGQALSTAPPTFSPFVPTTSQWRQETVPLAGFASNNNVVLKFKHTTGYENNLYLDDIRVTGILGIRDAESGASISLFPNPTAGSLTLQTALKPGAEARISVKNTLGQEVVLKKESVQDGKIELNLTGKPAGIYLIQVTAGSETFTKKVVLTK